jgi:hypothetical protein
MPWSNHQAEQADWLYTGPVRLNSLSGDSSLNQDRLLPASTKPIPVYWSLKKQYHMPPSLSLLSLAGANTRVFHRQELRPSSVTGFSALCVACFWPPLSRHSYLPKACESTRNRARNSTRMESSVGSSSVSIRVPKCMPSAGMWTTSLFTPTFASVLTALGRSTSGTAIQFAC